VTTTVTYGTPHKISVAVAVDGTGVIVADQAADSRCWYAEDNENATAVIPGTNGGTPIANGTAAQGISYNGTIVGASGITPCGPADGNWGTRTLVANWGPKYPA